MTARVAIALVHYPVVDAQGANVTTAITNLDIHDLARSARSYGCSDYFIVHPIEAQRALVQRICDHWADGSSGRRIPDRKEALSLIRIVNSIESIFDSLGGRQNVEVWVTAARKLSPPIRFADAKARLAESKKTTLIVFGTGWGLAKSVIDSADLLLEPICSSRSEYNHLSVRSACAITLDRLLAES